MAPALAPFPLQAMPVVRREARGLRLPGKPRLRLLSSAATLRQQYRRAQAELALRCSPTCPLIGLGLG